MSDNTFKLFMNLSNREPKGFRLPPPLPLSDGSCMAEGCEEKATDETLYGLCFCLEHFTAWYSLDTPRLKQEVWVLPRQAAQEEKQQ